MDAGANIGNHTVFYAREMKASRVFSFEPVPETFEILSRNILLNHLEKTVSAFACGVSDTQSRADFKAVDITNIGATKLLENNNGGIPVTTLDQAVREQRVDFLKIDVEGMEVRAVLGARNLIRMHFSCYGQTIGRHLMVNVLEALDGCGFVCLLTAGMIPSFGMNGVYIAIVMNSILSILYLTGYAIMKIRRISECRKIIA